MQRRVNPDPNATEALTADRNVALNGKQNTYNHTSAEHIKKRPARPRRNEHRVGYAYATRLHLRFALGLPIMLRVSLFFH
jgi:hypothetical protein